MKHSSRFHLSPRAAGSIQLGLRALILVAAPYAAYAQFTEVDPGIQTSLFECVVPGDYDHDGNVDIVVMGSGSHDIAFTTIYRNVNGVFSDSHIPLLGLATNSTCAQQAAAWADIDGDGDLDLAMSGVTTNGAPTVIVYRNDAGVFTPVASSFLPEFAGAVTWADYDGDGDPDLLVTGTTTAQPGGTPATRLYRNDNGTFTQVAHPFADVFLGPVAWGDFNGDGKLDVLICGTSSTGISSTLWLNQGGGTFVDSGISLPGVDLGFASFGDYDGDGKLDLLLGGNSTVGFLSSIYHNAGGTLTDINAGLLPVIWSSGAFGDYDHDGHLDAMIVGYDPVAQTQRSILYHNVGGNFVDSGNTFHDVYLGGVSWMDYNHDGNSDILLSGTAAGADVVLIYRNDTTCKAPQVYCTAKVNSLGCTPQIGLSGAPSASAGSGCTLRTTSLIGNKNGLFFHSTVGPLAAPFHGGFLCVKAPTKRHAVLSSGGTGGTCTGVLSEDLNVYIAHGTDPNLVAGATLWIQCWSRDPGDTFTDSLSDAVTALICL